MQLISPPIFSLVFLEIFISLSLSCLLEKKRLIQTSVYEFWWQYLYSKGNESRKLWNGIRENKVPVHWTSKLAEKCAVNAFRVLKSQHILPYLSLTKLTFTKEQILYLFSFFHSFFLFIFWCSNLIVCFIYIYIYFSFFNAILQYFSFNWNLQAFVNWTL